MSPAHAPYPAACLLTANPHMHLPPQVDIDRLRKYSRSIGLAFQVRGACRESCLGILLLVLLPLGAELGWR